MLTDYSNLFTRDFYLPTGDLRDLKSSYKRAEIIIVTKCKPDLTVEEKQKIIDEIKPLSNQHVFFTCIDYGELYHIDTMEKRKLASSTEILLVSGIANPKPLKAMLEEDSNSYHMLQYADHHIFSIDDLKDIKHKFESIQSEDKIILTTEKDAVRLTKFRDEIKDMPFYVLPVRHRFLFEEAEKFNTIIIKFINEFTNN